jgi:hypothetical protein
LGIALASAEFQTQFIASAKKEIPSQIVNVGLALRMRNKENLCYGDCIKSLFKEFWANVKGIVS